MDIPRYQPWMQGNHLHRDLRQVFDPKQPESTPRRIAIEQ